MISLRIGRLPAVRRKRKYDALMIAGYVAAIALVDCMAAWLHPFAGIVVLLLGAIIGAMFAQQEASGTLQRRFLGVTEVTRREDAPVLWDAVHACAAAVGIRPPRVQLFAPFVRMPAASWGYGKERSVGMQQTLVQRMPPDWVMATVSHEIAHIAMRDLDIGAVTVVAKAWLRLSSVALFSLGVMVALGPVDLARTFVALGACLVAVVTFVGVDVAEAYLMPYVRYQHEYAADAVGIAITGDPIGTIGLLVFLGAAGGEMSTDPRPRRGRTHPPPLVRIKAILAEHPRIFR